MLRSVCLSVYELGDGYGGVRESMFFYDHLFYYGVIEVYLK